MSSPPDESPGAPLAGVAGRSLRPGGHMPLAYAGQDLGRRARLGAPFATEGYGHDRGRVYRWNSLGYRAPEFDPEAECRIFAFGESHALGYFVEAEESWPARFTALYAEARGLAPGRVCYQNFAEVGACNSHVARTVLSQCAAAQPDLVLVHFGEHRRGEVFLDGRPHRIGPWLLEPETAEIAPASGRLRELYLEQIERGRHFFGFALGSAPDLEAEFSLEREATCLEETLRQILLVQSFCQSLGIPAIGTCDRADILFQEEVRRDAHLGPLVAQIDPDFLDPQRIWDVEGDTAEDGGHVGPERHRVFARIMYERFAERRRATAPMAPGGSVPDSPGGAVMTGDRVRFFYERMPFNFWHSASEAAERVRVSGALAAYPDLERLLAGGDVRRAIDCGCGGGWLSGTLAFHHGLEVTGIDFSPRSLERARALAAELGVEDRVRFIQRDLLALEPGELSYSPDLVMSLGVLHHIAEPRAAFERVVATVRPGGHLYLGLYHGPGREPFLRHFRRITLASGEEAAFEAFRNLDGAWHGDGEHARSWFRDQVLHPHESRHTLREITNWLGESGLVLESTSINRFAVVDEVEELFALEEDYAELGKQALEEGRFFPGFFTVMARREL